MPALPPRLSLEQVRRLAKELLRDLKDGDRAAIRRLAVVSAPSTLAGAQLAIAHEYGFPSWARLKRDVELRENFGPDAQLEQQTRAIERWGLLDTGGAWQVAHSGRTIAATGQWAEMLAGAGDDWEVLVVGYVSRFARDLRTAVNARHDLHARGAVILFADERVLSSDEDEWERWAREAVEAEAYSRRLAKRIREGYAAKRRRLGVPGGNRAPLGTVREGRTMTVDQVDMAVVRRVYELAAGGLTDREVGAATGLALKHVAEILTNP